MEVSGQFSLFGVFYDEYKTVESCQDYCITVPTCVSVDFKFDDNSCRLHNDPDHLIDDITFACNGTNQYRLIRTCRRTASGQLISCLLAVIVS